MSLASTSLCLRRAAARLSARAACEATEAREVLRRWLALSMDARPAADPSSDRVLHQRRRNTSIAILVTITAFVRKERAIRGRGGT